MKLLPLLECDFDGILPFCSDVYFSFLRNFPPPLVLVDDMDADVADWSLCITFWRAFESKSNRRVSSSL